MNSAIPSSPTTSREALPDRLRGISLLGIVMVNAAFLGAALARMEAEVTWRHLLARFPDRQAWTLAGTPVPNPGRMIHGLRSLPVQVSGRAPA